MNSSSGMSRIGNFGGSEKILNVSNNNKMRTRISPPPQPQQQRFASARTSPFCNRQAQLLVQNHANFRKSDEPAKVMYYDVNGSWVDYPKEVLDLVKGSFSAGKAVVEVNFRGGDVLLDFYRMLEIGFDSGDEKSIAWIDVKGKCFFPKVFVNSSEDFVECGGNDGNKCPKIEIEVKILGNSEDLEGLSGKRKRASEEIEVDQIVRENAEGSSSNVRNLDAKRRQIFWDESVKPRWEKTKVLKEGKRECMIVKNLFLSGLRTLEPDAVITSIHQCTRTGVLDKARYEVFMKQMEIMKKARGDANLIFAWHGTSAKNVSSILAHGFGMPDQVQTPQPYGVGVYFSPAKLPHLSATISGMDDNGEKHVILCRVLLGKCERIEAGSKQALPSSLSFDTGVDHLWDPKWYVVWPTNMSTHILPEVVVSYKSASQVQGQVTGTPCVKLDSRVPSPFVTKLFAKLGGSLPTFKVLQLQTLCASLKEGKVDRNVFMQQLRSVVGDEVLRSAINEIRG